MKNRFFVAIPLLAFSLTVQANEVLDAAHAQQRVEAQRKLDKVVRDAAVAVQLILPADLPNGIQNHSFRDLNLVSFSYSNQSVEGACRNLEHPRACLDWAEWMINQKDFTVAKDKPFLTANILLRNNEVVCGAKLPLGLRDQADRVTLAMTPMPMQVECASTDRKQMLLQTSSKLDNAGNADFNWEVNLDDETKSPYALLNSNNVFDWVFMHKTFNPYGFIARKHVSRFRGDVYEYQPIFSKKNPGQLIRYNRVKKVPAD